MKNKEYPEKGRIYFPPEWSPQDAVMLTWPHEDTDWAPMMPQVELTFAQIAREILHREKLMVVCRDISKIKRHFTEKEISDIIFYEIPSDDTWARDHGPICTFHDTIPVVNDFQFNGWGNKFNATLDNLITRELFNRKAFLPDVRYHEHTNFVLEGGSIETNGMGTLLTTSPCLLNPNRNPHLTKTEIENELKRFSGAEQVLWLDHGYLEGDDTDSHIDTLARFCKQNTICYVKCTDGDDLHFGELFKMEEQLKDFRTPQGEPFNLVALPMADPVYNTEGRRMSATYANFLIINGAVLVPVYRQPKDREALEIIAEIFPEREVVGINCLPLIEQNGSLHCITMQIPKGFIS